MPKIQKSRISLLPLPPLLHVLPPALTQSAVDRVRSQAQAQAQARNGDDIKLEKDREAAGAGAGVEQVVAGNITIDSQGRSKVKLRKLNPTQTNGHPTTTQVAAPAAAKGGKRKSAGPPVADGDLGMQNGEAAEGGEGDIIEEEEVELEELGEEEVVEFLKERRGRRQAVGGGAVNGNGFGMGKVVGGVGVKVENGLPSPSPLVGYGQGQKQGLGPLSAGGSGNGRLMVTPSTPTHLNGSGSMPMAMPKLPPPPMVGLAGGRLPSPPNLKPNVNGLHPSNSNINNNLQNGHPPHAHPHPSSTHMPPLPSTQNQAGSSSATGIAIAGAATTTAVGGAGGKDTSNDWKEPEVWVIRETGEMFLDYEQYVDRMMFYRQKIFHVETASHQISHLTPLSYFDALKAETKTSMEAQGAFSGAVKRAMLSAAQFSREGRLENLADRIYLRFANRFFENERIFVDLDGDTYFANVAEITLPSRSSKPSSSSSQSSSQSQTHEPHHLALQGEITQADLDERDPALEYRYRLQLISHEDVERNQHFSAAEDGPERWGENYVEVEAEKLSRDRIAFSKIGIKKFLKDSLERDAAIYSPWMVLSALVKRYGLPDQLPEHTRKAIEADRGIATEKRKRIWADKVPEEEAVVAEEGPASKKQKVNADGEAASKKKRAPRKKDGAQTQEQKEEEEKAEKARLEAEKAEEAARLEAEKKKKRKPYKYPAEDLLLELTFREKAIEKPEMRPTFNKNLPFPQHFEMFLGTWNFLNALSKPLGLSPFTIDEFENALYHVAAPQACTLLQEVHQTLLNIVRRDAVEAEQAPVLPLKASVAPPSIEGSSSSEDDYEADEDKEERVNLVTKYATAQADTFLEKDTGGKAGRKDWENMLIGCLWARGSSYTLPNMLKYCEGMLFDLDAPTNRPTWSAASTRPKISKNIPARYVALHSTFKLEIISFLCELAMQTMRCRDYYEVAIAALSKCRNDQVATKRELNKFTTAENPAIDADGDVQMEDGSHAASHNGDVEMHIGSDEGSEGGSEASGSRNARNKHTVARQQAIQAKLARQQAETAARLLQTEQDKADAKAKKAERDEERRLIDELARLDREFRRQSNALRTNPLGQDRFCYKVWWLDGCGTVELVNSQHEVSFGTGRLYVQGVHPDELERTMEEEEVTAEEMAAKRAIDEPEDDALAKGEWAVIDSLEQFQQWHFWLNAKGKREGRLLKAIEPFKEVIELQIKSREAQQQVVEQPEMEGLLARRQKRGGHINLYKNKESFLGYKNLYK